MSNLNNFLFYKPLLLTGLIEVSIAVTIYLMIISLFTEKRTSLSNQLQFFVLPLIWLLFWLLKAFNIFDFEIIPFNTLLVLVIGVIMVVLIELKFGKK